MFFIEHIFVIIDSLWGAVQDRIHPSLDFLSFTKLEIAH